MDDSNNTPAWFSETAPRFELFVTESRPRSLIDASHRDAHAPRMKAAAADTDDGAGTINQLGLDLHRLLAKCGRRDSARSRKSGSRN